MNKKILKIAIVIATMLFALILFNTKSSAASFDAKISTTNAKVGDTITVTVTANNAAGMYSVSADNGNVSHTGGSTSEFLEAGSTTVTYKAVKEGTVKITANAKDMTDLDDDTKAVKGSKTFTVTIKSNGTSSAGNNNNSSKKGTVSSCKINGVTVKEYLNVTNKDSVPVVVKTSTGEGLTIYNSLTKKSYKVKSGEKANVQILEGTNTLTITLDSGAKATRKIYSQKEEVVKPNNIEENQDQENDVKVTLKTLKIDGFTLAPEFSPEVYEYTLDIPEDKSDITQLNILVEASQKDFTVEIKGNEDLQYGENIITIIVKSKDGEQTSTYTIKVNKEQTAVQVAANVEEIPQEVEEVKENETAKWIIVIFTALVAIAGIVFAVIEYQYGKKHGINKEPKIPFANIGFETEQDTKSSILGNIEEDKTETINDEKISKKGKHF